MAARNTEQKLLSKIRGEGCGCPHRRFLPVTYDVIRRHHSGQGDDGRDFVMGTYPILLDETCFFPAVDFDKAHWREDVAVFLETCRGEDQAEA